MRRASNSTSPAVYLLRLVRQSMPTLKKLWPILLVCALLVAGLSQLSRAQQNKGRKETATQSQADAGTSSAKPTSGNSQAAPVTARKVRGDRPQSISGKGEVSARSGIATPQRAVGPVYSQIPQLTPEQVKEQEQELNEVNFLPPPKTIGAPRNDAPINPPTEPSSDQNLVKSASTIEPKAPNDFTYRTVHDLTASEASNSRSVIDEPSVANMGNTVFYTGNWFAARSTDGGQSFTYVSPYNTFPSINGGFCCDQVANYAPNQDMLIWALQYVSDSTSGTLRIARAVGATAVANNSWTYYDFNPQKLGFATNNWLDFPNITISDNYLYASSNVFSTSGSSFTGSVVWRIRLSELAAGGAINFQYLTRTDVGAPRCTEGAHTTMYWGTIVNSTQVKIFRWDDSSSTIFFDDVNVNSFIILNRDGVATSPDGTNWAARADFRILGAWVANGVIGFMWPAKQGGSFPYPYIVIARFNQSNRALISQNQLWSQQSAWLYPSASVNAVGNLAGLAAYGGGSFYPGTNIWISDDVQNGFNPLALYGATSSNVGPSSNAWGDYHAIRPHKNDVNTWVASTYYLQNGGSNTIPRYLWFGRERDFGSTPPPSAPTASAATNVTSSSFTANWSSSSGATGYRLDVSTSSAFGSYVSGYQDLDVGNVLSRNVTGLSANTTYFFRVRAYNVAGTSGNSNTVSVTTTTATTLRIDNVVPKAGRATGGQAITLTGAFAGLNTVTIGGTAVTWSYTSGTSAIAFNTPAHAVGAVDIVLTPTTGSTVTKTNAFAYLPTTFTDNTLVVGTTLAKAQHITELRQAVDALRAVAGLAPATWTDTALVPFGTTIKAIHIMELRTNLEAAAAQLGYTAVSYTDPSLTASFQIKRIHIEELRQRLRAIAG